jgi:hypothetical protein
LATNGVVKWVVSCPLPPLQIRMAHGERNEPLGRTNALSHPLNPAGAPRAIRGSLPGKTRSGVARPAPDFLHSRLAVVDRRVSVGGAHRSVVPRRQRGGCPRPRRKSFPHRKTPGSTAKKPLNDRLSSRWTGKRAVRGRFLRRSTAAERVEGRFLLGSVASNGMPDRFLSGSMAKKTVTHRFSLWSSRLKGQASRDD